MKSTVKPIDLVRYAETMAHLQYFAADTKDEVIARLGLQKPAFEEAAATWKAAREAELANGKAELAVRYGNVLVRTRKRLEMQRPSLESLGPMPSQDATAGSAFPARASPDPWGQEQEHPSKAPRAAALEAPSFMVERRPPMPAAVASLGGIVSPPPNSNLLSTTMPLGVTLPLLSLPFQEGSAAPEQAFEAAVAHARAVQGLPPPHDSSMKGRTVVVSDQPMGAVLPFAGHVEPGVPELTLSQYASLRVELQMYPHHHEAILARYGVPKGGCKALEAAWQARFQTDPPARMEFARAYAAYTAWLRVNPQG